MQILICDSVLDGVCQNPTGIEVNPEFINLISSYQGFVEDFYWVGFNSVMGLFIAGLGIGLILNIIRKLK